MMRGPKKIVDSVEVRLEGIPPIGLTLAALPPRSVASFRAAAEARWPPARLLPSQMFGQRPVRGAV